MRTVKPDEFGRRGCATFRKRSFHQRVFVLLEKQTHLHTHARAPFGFDPMTDPKGNLCTYIII